MKPFGAIPPWQDLFVSSYVSLTWGNRGVGKQSVMKKLIYSCAFAVGLAMGLSACTDPYDPGQRAIGGGLFGAGTGAAIGGIAVLQLLRIRLQRTRLLRSNLLRVWLQWVWLLRIRLLGILS
jgi:hypothetical protein